MVDNHIRSQLAEQKMSARALAEQMPDEINPVAMTFIVNGKVLPTKDGLRAICTTLSCEPKDLYNIIDLDFLSECCHCESEKQTVLPVKAENEAETVKGGDEFVNVPLEPRCHEGMEQLRVWMEAEEEIALRRAVSSLGYRSVSEWLRDMYRKTIQQYLALGLKQGETALGKVLSSDGIKPSEVIV